MTMRAFSIHLTLKDILIIDCSIEISSGDDARSIKSTKSTKRCDDNVLSLEGALTFRPTTTSAMSIDDDQDYGVVTTPPRKR
jgi:hypothetical protein